MKTSIRIMAILLLAIAASVLSFSACGQPQVNAVEDDIKLEETASKEVSKKSTEEPVIPAEVKDITPEEVYTDMISEDPSYYILDVRTQEEYDQGHIEGSDLIPVSMLEENISEIPVGVPIVVYCKSGGRSASAAHILVEKGFSQVYDMGGISEWVSAGFPVVTD